MPKLNINLKLVGEDGNAYAILSRARRAIRSSKLSAEEKDRLWSEFEAEATSGDYDHLIATAMKWFEMDDEDDD
jgi:hypothetical protein